LLVSQIDSYQHHYLLCLLSTLAALDAHRPAAAGGRWLRRPALLQLVVVYAWTTM